MTCFDDVDVWFENYYDLRKLAAQGRNQDFFRGRGGFLE